MRDASFYIHGLKSFHELFSLMVMKSHVLNAEVLEMTFHTNAKLTKVGFEITYEKMTPRVFAIEMVNCRVKFPCTFQSID
jgi:hypothetical protein